MKKLNIVLPVYNEEKTIANTIIEFNTTLSKYDFEIEFVIVEDGSTDNSVEVIRSLQKLFNIKLFTSELKSNYSAAVLKGLNLADEELIAFVDSDGQYNPKDLLNMIDHLIKGSFVAGYRSPRVDNIFRKILSYSFKIIYYRLLNISLVDPSCSYFVCYKEDLKSILKIFKTSLLPEGFWWEFYAYSTKVKIDIIQVPVQHFTRNYGNSVVFKLSKIPKIGIINLIGLLKLKYKLKL